MYIRGAAVSWDAIPPDSYLRAIPALAEVERITFQQPVTFFVGENGSGKSTLLEAVAIAAGFNPEGGTRNYAFSTRDTHSELFRALRLIRNPSLPKWGYFLRAESFYNVATAEEAYAKNGNGASAGFHDQSHGESFLSMVQDHFVGNGLYLLDEPEAALSPPAAAHLDAGDHPLCPEEGPVHHRHPFAHPPGHARCGDSQLRPQPYPAHRL